MVNLDKLYNWGVNGPFSNDLNQLDPATIMMIMEGIQFAGDLFGGGGEEERRGATSEFTDQIGALGEDVMAKYQEFTDMAGKFMPGGAIHEGFKKEAYQTAMDTALTTAQKGSEMLQAKGVDLTSYGTGTMRDVAKETYTKSFTEDYSDIFQQMTGTAASLYETGAGMYGSYLDLMGTSAQAEYTMGLLESETPGPLEDITSFFGSETGSKVGSKMIDWLL